MNKWIDKKTFQGLLKDGMSMMVGGFLTCGTPEVLIDWVVQSNVKDLTIIANDAGYPDKGVGKLIANGQVTKLIASHIGTNPNAGKMMSENKMDVTLIPQGSLIEMIRSKGAGLGGVLTPVGLYTLVEQGKQIIKIKERDYLLEEAMGADIALIESHQSDAIGNLTYAKSARNFNPVMATAADLVFAYVYHQVDIVNPEVVITPHIFVDYLIGGHHHER
ncbi:MAG: 3-oxoacid CoA-transferase subunit A [Acholeplasmataceae bacterium]|nr:3-oxoacid CoA-transferase subunit A [Acholeplasmataceae bacterium]